MARLIVEAVSDETSGSDVVGDVLMYVSVSQESDGRPVTGLTKDNFRITSSIGSVIDPHVFLVSESKWETADVELAGVYSIWISRGQDPSQPNGIPRWSKGQFYAFAIQARTFAPEEKDDDGPPLGRPRRPRRTVLDQGQTVVSLQSLGT